MGRYVAYDAPEADRIVAEAVNGVGDEITALAVPRLAGVVLGGGYGRGEGGVRMEEVDGKMKEGLSNDLDFFAITEDGTNDETAAVVASELAPIADRWTRRLGIDVDFTVRTPWRIRHDQERLMIQELIHGYVDVAGLLGKTLFGGIRLREPAELPWNEAARLMMNRGMGLMLAREEGKSGDFIARNINKCILGAGDARLIARGKYLWKAKDRASALGDELYSAATEWKFRPRGETVCDWETARSAWLDALDEISGAASPSRSLYEATRWIVRRRTVGDLRTLGMDSVVRILRQVAHVVRERGRITASLREDWRIFN